MSWEWQEDRWDPWCQGSSGFRLRLWQAWKWRQRLMWPSQPWFLRSWVSWRPTDMLWQQLWRRGMCNDQLVSRTARRSFVTQDVFGRAVWSPQCFGEEWREGDHVRRRRRRCISFQQYDLGRPIIGCSVTTMTSWHGWWRTSLKSWWTCSWSQSRSRCGGRWHSQMKMKECWKWEAEGKVGICFLLRRSIFWDVAFAGLRKGFRRRRNIMAGWVHLSRKECVSEEGEFDRVVGHVWSTALNRGVKWPWSMERRGESQLEEVEITDDGGEERWKGVEDRGMGNSRWRRSDRFGNGGLRLQEPKTLTTWDESLKMETDVDALTDAWCGILLWRNGLARVKTGSVTGVFHGRVRCEVLLDSNDDQSEEHPLERSLLRSPDNHGKPANQLSARHWRSVPRGACAAVLNLNFTSEMSTWIIRVACEIEFLPPHPDTGALSHSRGTQFTSWILPACCLMECGLETSCWPSRRNFSGGDHNCEEKWEHNTAGKRVGSPFECHRGRRPRSVVAGVLNEFC